MVSVLAAGVAVAIVAWGIVVFNRLIALRNQVHTAWADIDVQLTRRHALVPQLVAAVRGYTSHERGVLEAVTDGSWRCGKHTRS
jgi:LemA protein